MGYEPSHGGHLGSSPVRGAVVHLRKGEADGVRYPISSRKAWGRTDDKPPVMISANRGD